MSDTKQEYQLGEDEYDVARELAAEEHTAGYVEVRYTSPTSQRTATYQVRPPTLKETDDNRRAASRVRKDGGKPMIDSATRQPLTEIDAADFMARQLISSVYVKRKGQWVPCWTIHDKDTLLASRGSPESLITKLTEAFHQATRLRGVEEEKGNSDASPSASPS